MHYQNRRCGGVSPLKCLSGLFVAASQKLWPVWILNGQNSKFYGTFNELLNIAIKHYNKIHIEMKKEVW